MTLTIRLPRLLLAGLLPVLGFGATGIEPRVVDAAKNNDPAALRALLGRRADVNLSEPDGTTALHWAAHWNDAEAVKLLLRAGAKAGAANIHGVTPLSEACTNGNAAIIESLLQAGVDPNSISGEGETALMTAARTGKPEAVALLLKHGAAVDAREDWRGQTALMWAAAEGHAAAVRLLIAHGAKVNAQSKVFDHSERKRKPASFPMIWPRGGFTPLLYAVRRGDREIARLLLDAGADINLGDPDRVTPLVVAILNGHYDLAHFLLEKGADPDIADTSTGRTALYAAVDMQAPLHSIRPAPRKEDRLNSLDIIRELLDRGAKVNVQLKDAAQMRSPHDGTDPILRAGATPFLRAAMLADLVVMRLLLDKGADPLLATNDKSTPLMAAAGLGYREGLGTGTESDAIEAVRICLERGADVNAVNDAGRTAVHGAASKGVERVLQFLFDHGARLDVKDKSGYTPLALANGSVIATHVYPRPNTTALLTRLLASGPAGKAPQQ